MSMQLAQNIEEKIKNEAVKLLSAGRPDWDVQHTLCAVGWMRKLIEREGGDERVLIPAIYFHDTGYEEMKKGYSHEECLAAKLDHGKRGADNVKSFLPTLDYFSPEEIERIYYLVFNHGIHDNVDEPDRQLILEADGLAQIDWENCPPNYDKANCLKFLDMTFKTDRIPYVKTETGKKLYEELMAKAYNYLEKMEI